MNRTRGVLVPGAMVLLAVLAGCSIPGQAQSIGSTRTSGAPSTTTGAASTTTIGHATDGAPAVAHPLDASAILKDPCSALIAGELSSLGFGGVAPHNNSDAVGPGCAWMTDSFFTVNVEWIPVNANGLRDLYRQQRSMAYWRPTEVSGYPAVFADAAPQQNNGCLLNTAVNDHLYFLAGVQEAASNDQACVVAQQVAADVIKNLGGG